MTDTTHSELTTKPTWSVPVNIIEHMRGGVRVLSFSVGGVGIVFNAAIIPVRKTDLLEVQKFEVNTSDNPTGKHPVVISMAAAEDMVRRLFDAYFKRFVAALDAAANAAQAEEEER